MTISEWAKEQSGRLLKIPAGTLIGHEHYYRYPLDHPEHPGEWSTGIEAWKVKIAHEYRAITTQKDQYIEIHLDAGLLVDQAKKALSNRAGKSRDGAMTLKRYGGKR